MITRLLCSTAFSFCRQKFLYTNGPFTLADTKIDRETETDTDNY